MGAGPGRGRHLSALPRIETRCPLCGVEFIVALGDPYDKMSIDDAIMAVDVKLADTCDKLSSEVEQVFHVKQYRRKSCLFLAGKELEDIEASGAEGADGGPNG